MMRDIERAKLRAVKLTGDPSVAAFIASRLGVPPNDPAVRSARNTLSRGLKRRDLMVSMARLFDVPPTFWLEEDPDRLRAMIDAPPSTTTDGEGEEDPR